MDKLELSGFYNFKNQPERLIYLGENWSSNGWWHQFSKIESPCYVWCELLDSDLKLIEKTKELSK